jgi:hypothetical protein
MIVNAEMVAANNRTLWVAQQANVSNAVVNGAWCPGKQTWAPHGC